MTSLPPHPLSPPGISHWCNSTRSQRAGESDDVIGKGQPLRTHTMMEKGREWFWKGKEKISSHL